MVHPLKCGVIAWRGIVRQGWFLRNPDQGRMETPSWDGWQLLQVRYDTANSQYGCSMRLTAAQSVSSGTGPSMLLHCPELIVSACGRSTMVWCTYDSWLRARVPYAMMQMSASGHPFIQVTCAQCQAAT